jgi:large subunit ribosomal protein L19
MKILNKLRYIHDLQNRYLKTILPSLNVGDGVKIGVKIIEGNKERIQYYEGTIIAKKNSSINTTITVRKILKSIAVERIFLVHSPQIESILVLRSSKVKKSKLYYLRNLKGKATRLIQKVKKN